MSDDLRQHKDLRDAGYAPGNYTFKCIDCEQEAVGDKRARRCLPCAEKRVVSEATPLSSKEITSQLGKLLLEGRITGDQIAKALLEGVDAIQADRVRMRAEIERLTRGMNGQADVMVAREREFAAALKRLDELERANVGLATESERLRAALERIKRIGPLGVDTYPECYRRMHAIAVAALSGEPTSAVETFDVREANRKLCAAEGHVLSGPVRPCLRCHEWFDPHYGSPLNGEAKS